MLQLLLAVARVQQSEQPVFCSHLSDGFGQAGELLQVRAERVRAEDGGGALVALDLWGGASL